MKNACRLIVLLAFLTPAVYAAAPNPSDDDQAVLSPVQAFFAGMTQRNAEAMRATLLPGGSLVLMREGKPVQMTFDDFANRVAKPAPTHIEERIHHPVVRIDHDLAVVWAPFDFLVDGKVDHCGTDLFSLVLQNDHWLIAGIADTGRKTCPAQ
ncbi:MAG TPA: nuclear transport factor 2 family protein [Acidobacteriaceae bacterium]|nr:nuclear transport factor 2 family protein [Acidobacteriaceae bacterium]